MVLPDKCVNSRGCDVVDLLNSSLDLTLVSFDVDDENKGIVIFNFLHGSISGKREFNDIVSSRLNRPINNFADFRDTS